MTGRDPEQGSSGSDWRPSAAIETLRTRAVVLRQIRELFHTKGVLEVEPPNLSRATVTDRHLHSLRTVVAERDGDPGRCFYLQTSPEFAMKRLLAAGSGAIYALCRAFRDGESGRHHNPEFTMLEWYRPGFDHHRLMDEVDELLGIVLASRLEGASERRSYAELYARFLDIDPHRAGDRELVQAAARLAPGVTGLDRSAALQLLFSHGIEPRLPEDRLTFVYDYPASEAALARTRSEDDVELAERFEVYLGTVELANGFHELTDPVEQRRRFAEDLAWRRANGLAEVPVDERLLSALEAGLPACAGVALGVDRLVMLAAGSASLAEVLAFSIDRA